MSPCYDGMLAKKAFNYFMTKCLFKFYSISMAGYIGRGSIIYPCSAICVYAFAYCLKLASVRMTKYDYPRPIIYMTINCFLEFSEMAAFF